MDDKESLRIGEGKPGPGRPKGVPNKVNGLLRDMILQALEGAGGVEYLQQQADSNPNAFLSLIGRVLPLQVSGDGGGPVKVSFTWKK
jgi:hypothetical protein